MEAVKQLEQKYRKQAIPQAQSGDTVKVHQRIREGNKQRIQVFEGVVIRTHRPNDLTANITVRRIASGVGVEKTFLLHSPNVAKVEVLRRGKVRRNFLSYMRGRRGKSARLTEIGFDKTAANAANEVKEEPKAEADVEPKTDEELDAEVTEISESVPVEESTETVAKQEDKEAATEDASNPAKDVDASEEADAPAEEFAEGVDKAEQQDTSKGA